MPFDSVIFGGALNDIVPAAKLPGGVRSVQVDVGLLLLATPHTFAVKEWVPPETTSTPVRMYPASFEPARNLCERTVVVRWVSVLPWPMLLTRLPSASVTVTV